MALAQASSLHCPQPCRKVPAVVQPNVQQHGVASLRGRSSFFGTTLPKATIAHHAQRRCKIALTVRAAGEAKQITVDVDKPLGLNLAKSKSKGGGLVVKNASGNAAKAGISSGDTVIYTSSFFGDELWPSDDLTFTKSALAAAPNPVTITYVKGQNDTINVKRLPKKKAPPRFGRKLTAAQQELATHICVDCGYIYTGQLPFDQVSNNYKCPQCSAPKKRFAPYDKATGKAKAGSTPQLTATILTVVVGLAGIGALFYVGLKL